MDAFYISKYFGATKLAGYALGLTIASYLRAVYGIVFSPFSAKFNHFIGMNEHKELHKYFEKVALYTLPLTVFPVMILFFSTKSFVFSWVGKDYADSVDIAKLLILGLMGGFITYPVGLLLMAYQKSKILFWGNAILPIIFWAGVFIGVPKIGVTAIAFSKLMAFTTVFFIYLFISCKEFIDNTKLFLFSILKYTFIPGLSIYLLSIFLSPYLPYSKSSTNLLIYISYCLALFLFATFVFVVLSKELRTFILAKLSTVKLFK
jgi:O-antigen/teichoic acid export membrane protein